jgi:hypothetical protein
MAQLRAAEPSKAARKFAQASWLSLMFTPTKQDSVVIAVTLGIFLSVPLLIPAFYETTNITVVDQAVPAAANDKLAGHLAKPNSIDGDDLYSQKLGPELDCELPI